MPNTERIRALVEEYLNKPGVHINVRETTSGPRDVLEVTFTVDNESEE